MERKLVSPEKIGMSSERLDRTRPAMQKYIDNGTLRGMTTMVARKGEVVHFEQQGYRDKEAGKPMTADTIFRIYSMTKPVAAVALMMLYEHGLFHLGDLVAKFMPAFGKLKVFNRMDDDGTVHTVDLESHPTVSQLLAHAAGFTYGFLADPPDYGYGFGLGSRVMMNPAEAQKLGSVGEHGWAGAAKTYFWIDPVEEMAGVFMSQAMMWPDPIQLDFRNLAYQAIVD